MLDVINTKDSALISSQIVLTQKHAAKETCPLIL